MPRHPDYPSKFEQIAAQTLYPRLPASGRCFVRERAILHRFTLQELRLVSEIALDLEMWRQGDISELWPANFSATPDKTGKKQLLKALRDRWEALREAPNRYPPVPLEPRQPVKAKVLTREKGELGLGFCPVASPKTRCCNLLTLDAVDNCGYGCSYCSIQSFFDGNRVFFDRRLEEKLAALPIDPTQIYHIGTGQSSDSLMWGNSHGLLDTLTRFAERHPNVILEFKTKSANTRHLLKQQLPANMLFTWSLNPQPVIDHEEHGTASLEQRIDAARQLADRGAIIGFHFHPMIHYAGWQADYSALFDEVQCGFSPEQVAMISLGTLTFTRPVIRKIRKQGNRSQILKLPLVETDGKLSYPDEIKLALFSHAYDSFSSAWKEQVFFYLCMENQRFWRPVFGFEYPSNDAFEQVMKQRYLSKIQRCRRTVIETA
jgi:spore photoproduct lyase